MCRTIPPSRRTETQAGSGTLRPGRLVGVDRIWPFVLVGLVVFVFGGVVIQNLRTEKRTEPIKETVLADPVVRNFPAVRVQLNPGTQRSSFLKGGSDLTVRTRSFDFGLAPPFRRAFRHYFSADGTEMRAARLTFGNTRSRDCILITGEWGGKQMEAAIAADDQLAEMWMFLASAGVTPMSEAP
jgi:hypothetical protein